MSTKNRIAIAQKNAGQHERRRKYVALFVVVLMASVGLVAVLGAWRGVSGIRTLVSTSPHAQPAPPPSIPPPGSPSKEYIYGGGKLIAIESAGKSDQTITFASIADKTFSDAPFAISADSTSGLPVSFSVASGPATVGGNTVTITGTGTVVIRADQSGNGTFNPGTAVTRSFNIAPAIATVTLTSLSQTYDAAPHYASATTSPANLNVTLSYSQSGTPVSSPTSAGNYLVTATINESNYQGNATGTLVINKANATLSLDSSSLSQTYNGTPRVVTATIAPAGVGAVTITYDGSAGAPTNAGNYSMVASLTNTNYQAADATGTLTVARSAQTTTFNPLADKTFGDTPFALTASSSSGLLLSFSIQSGPATVSGSTLTITGAGTVTVRASQTGNTNFNAAADVSLSFNVAKAAATITLGNLSQTYDGTAKSAGATTSPGGLTVIAITYDGSSTVPTAAGSYAVAASLTNANYAASNATGTLVVAKAAATITLGNMSPTYDSTPKPAGATTSPAGLTVIAITYNGSSTAPTNAGSYAVVASLTNGNYTAANATGTLVVNKGSATITLSNLSQPYDGTPKAATTTTNPASLSGVSVTYNGSSTAPTNAGNYAVVASLTNGNYTAANATGFMAVTKGAATITLSNLSQTYNGTPKAATATTSPAGLSGVSITYNGSGTAPTSAGSYAVVASLTNSNYTAANATGTLVIARVTPTVTWNRPNDLGVGVALSATQLNATASVAGTFAYSPPAGTVLSIGANQPLSVTFTPTDGVNYNNALASVSIDVVVMLLADDFNDNSLDLTKWSIVDPVSPAIVSEQSQQLWITVPLNTATYNGIKSNGTYDMRGGSVKVEVAQSISQAGYCDEYFAAELDPQHVYMIAAGGASINFTVQVGTTFDTTTATYQPTDRFWRMRHDQSANTMNFETSADGLSWTVRKSVVAAFSTNGLKFKLTAGAWAIGNPNPGSAHFDNFQASNNKAPATITLSALNQTYDGAAKSATATTSPAGLSGISITYNGSATAPTNAGSYAIVASLTNSNYSAANATGTLVINKGTATITLSNLSQTYNGTPETATATTSPAGLSGVSLTYNGSSTAPTAVGSYAVVASLTNGNYTATNATGTLVIAKAAATITLGNLSQTYDGSPKAAIATTSPAGLSGVSLTYNGSSTVPTSAGSYAVVASLTNSNYTAANATGTLVVNKGTATITLSNLSQTYSATPKTATATTSPAGLSGVSITYNGSATAPTTAGSYAVVASLTNANYAASNVAGTLVIAKVTPTVTWNRPNDIGDGVALSATQLNATANVAGTFTYLPAAGTIMLMYTPNKYPTDTSNQLLSVTFAPTDSVDYNNASATVNITVATILLADDFNDNSLDATKWSIGSPGAPAVVSEQGQQLLITVPPNTFTYNQIVTNGTYDMRGGNVKVEVAQPISQAGWCDNYLSAQLDANNAYSIDVGGGSIKFIAKVGGASDTTSEPYNPTTDRFWRIRHNNDTPFTIFFETSADGSIWIPRKAFWGAFLPTGLKFSLGAGCSGTGNSNPGAAHFDNFQLTNNGDGTSISIE